MGIIYRFAFLSVSMSKTMLELGKGANEDLENSDPNQERDYARVLLFDIINWWIGAMSVGYIIVRIHEGLVSGWKLLFKRKFIYKE